MPVITYDQVKEAMAVVEDLQRQVSAKKYQLPGEEHFGDVISRVCIEAKKHYHEVYESLVPFDEVENMLGTGRFIPAGSINSGIGNTRIKCSLSNCYVTPFENDSIEGIFDGLKKAARTFSYRGGTGMDLTILRPKDEPVNNAARTSSGAVSFMPLISNSAESIGQMGRRGALLLSIDIRHPDAMRFIWCKSRPEEVFGKDFLTGKLPDVYGANISLKLTDAFMSAAIHGEDWEFVFPDREADKDLYDTKWNGNYEDWAEAGGTLKSYGSVNAATILHEIATAAHGSGDPGVLFIDTVIQNTPGSDIHRSLRPLTTNPCGEQPVGPYNNCLLGAMVFSKYVDHPFTESAKFNQRLFLDDVKRAVMFMNVMSDINEDLHPLKEQREADKFGKRIGIEFTALGDTLAMLGIKYGSPEAIVFIENTLRAKAIKEIESSALLAEKGKCAPALRDVSARRGFLENQYIKGLELPDHLRANIVAYGLANTAFNTVGPTGSISIISNNCTSGIEPLFMFSYARQTRLDPNKYFHMIHKPALDYILDNYSRDELEAGVDLDEIKSKLCYVEAWEVPWIERIDMQSAAQQYTDSSISSTVNLPETATVEEIVDIYTTAWENDLKGITVFRDGCKKGVLVSTEAANNEGKVVAQAQTTVTTPYIQELLDEERSVRHRVHWKGSKIYIIVTLDDDDNPLEVFAKLPREAGINGNGMYSEEHFQEKYSLWETVTRLVSLLLRSGMPVEKIIDQLEKSAYSIVDASAILCRILRKYLPSLLEEGEFTDAEIVAQELGKTCPECGKKAYVFEGGCGACRSCGYTTCG